MSCLVTKAQERNPPADDHRGTKRERTSHGFSYAATAYQMMPLAGILAGGTQGTGERLLKGAVPLNCGGFRRGSLELACD